MIYLASPYTHVEEWRVEDRFKRACAAVARLSELGLVVYSPIVHFHPVSVRHKLPGDFAFWKRINFAMIDKADELRVLQLYGWEDSIGVKAEIEYARGLALPIKYEDAEWLR